MKRIIETVRAIAQNTAWLLSFLAAVVGAIYLLGDVLPMSTDWWVRKLIFWGTLPSVAFVHLAFYMPRLRLTESHKKEGTK